MKLSIIIPSLNEKDTIDKVIDVAKSTGLRFFDEFEIIVADNGSTDGSLELLHERKDIKLLSVPVRGYGAALHFGILSAKYSYILFADADLSYDFSEIGKFIPYIKKDYDLILGSRFKGEIEKGAMPFTHRFIGTPILTSLIRWIYKIKTSDCNSGMRAVKKSFYLQLSMKNSGMEWASELLIKTALKKGKYIEVPIYFYKDQRKRKPHLRRWEDGWRHLKVIILLKPELLIIFALIMIIIGLLFILKSLFTTIAMVLFAEFWLLSYLALQKLRYVIHKTSNPINDFIDKFPLAFIASVLTVSGILQLFVISDNHLFTKYILLFQAVLIDLWIFFIETIKTHLVNPLPDKI